MLTTYAGLKQAVADWLDRDNLTAYIPDFITLAESMIWDNARVREMEHRDSAFSVDGKYVSVPTDYIVAKRLHLDTNPITKVSFSSQETLLDKANATSGKPTMFTVVGDEFEFNKTPDTTYTGTLVYYRKLTALSDSNASNAILTSYPNLYLYGALIQAEPFIGNDPRVATWKAMYDMCLNSANASAKEGNYSNGLTVLAGAVV